MSRTIINSRGRMYVCPGGTADETVVNYYGDLYVSSGASAEIAFNPWQGNIHSSAGAGVTYLERDADLYYGGAYIGLISKGDAFDDLLITSGRSALVYSGGTMNSATVNRNGSMVIYDGGNAGDIGWIHRCLGATKPVCYKY